ncbi:MAG: glycoside hydrolase domain-containing protein [Promethearchaeota archaeon]
MKDLHIKSTGSHDQDDDASGSGNATVQVTVEKKEVTPGKGPLLPVNAAMALLLFLLTFWLFFSYGPTDLALSEPYDEILPILMIAPFLGCPFFIYLLKKRKPRVIPGVKLVLVITICVVHVVHLAIVGLNPVFSSRWTWQYNDLRELNYLVPTLKIVAFIASICLFFLIYQEFFATRSNSGGKSNILNVSFAGSLGIVFLGFIGFGIFQEICVTQPLWVSLSILAWLGLVMCFLILIGDVRSWRLVKVKQVVQGESSSGAGDHPDAGRASVRFMVKKFPLKARIRIRSRRTAILVGIALWCLFVSFYPAQLVFQEGPTSAWGASAVVGAVTAMFLMVAWSRARMTKIQAFFTVSVVTLISPVLLVFGVRFIPGIVPAAITLSLMGSISTLAWILFYGYTSRERWSPQLTLICAWLWGTFFVIFFHDPLFEIWEFEERLLDLSVTFWGVADPFGTGVGLAYLIVFYIALAGLAFSLVLLFIGHWIKRRAFPSSSSSFSSSSSLSSSPAGARPPSRSSKARRAGMNLKTRKKQMQASILTFIFVFSSTLILTRVNSTRNAPVIIAGMGDHGVLWMANSYDRVLPGYRPDFATSPRNSTIDVRAMIGETELVQLVFSPLVSKMISFQGVRWSSPGGDPGDNLWKEEGGALVQIPVTTGRVGYLNCFDSHIADVLLPWTSFITGSGSRENIPFWMEISVPRNVSAGVYTTQFEYMTTSYLQRVPRAASLSFTIQLTVWNVTRPLNRTMDTCVGLQPENQEHVDDLIKLSIGYGADPYDVGNPGVSYNPGNLSAGLTINWTAFDNRVQEMLDAGMNHIKIDFYPGIDCRHDAESVVNGSKDNYLTLIRWFYGNASLHLASKTTPWGTTWESEAITQHSDEPDPNLEPLALQAFDILYKIINNVSSIRSFQTFKYEPAFDEWLDCLDIWVLTPDSFSVNVANKIHAAGHEVWTYSNGDNFPGTDTDLRTPLIMSRLRGWVDYHYNISGFLHWIFYWNYNDAGRSGCGYDGRGDGTEIVPYYDGYLPTLRLAAFRDGLEDNDLLWMLNRTVARCHAENITSPILDEAHAILRSVDQSLEKQMADRQWPIPVVTREFDHAAPTYINLRLECGRILEGLNSLF